MKFFNQSAQQLEIIPPVFPLVNIFFYFFSNSLEHQRNEKSDYANLFAIGCIFYFGMGGTALSPGGTRLAPTEAARRPVACCFERPEQLQYFTVFIIAKEIGDVNQRKTLCRKCTEEGQKCALITPNFRCS